MWATEEAAFVVALTSGFGFTGPITVFFATLWLSAGWLFREGWRGGAYPPSI